MSTIDRQLATIRTISALEDIPGADKIVAARLDGWVAVVQRDQFSVGEEVIYIECDAWVPHSLAPFLSKGKEPRIYNGVPGERLKTVKLRGQLSQGLVLKFTKEIKDQMVDSLFPQSVNFGQNLDQLLNIQKFEKPVAGELVGRVRNWPSFIPKTDQERIQNIWHKVEERKDEEFEVTLKLDGSSMTVYQRDGHVGVCSRNMEIDILDENKDNKYIRVAIDSGLVLALSAINRNLAIQGELMGPNIQGNRENLTRQQFFVFDVFDIDKQEYFTSHERCEFINRITEDYGLNRYLIDIVYTVAIMKPMSTLDKMLDFANGHSLNNPVREGLVWKSINDPSFSFKVISNKFLLAEKD